MVNITLKIPKKLHAIMKKHSEVKWDKIAKHAIEQRAKDLELLEKISSRSTMTMKDVMELDEIIKEGVWKRHKESMKA